MSDKIECVVTDLDGTLLQRDGSISAEDRAAVEALKQQDISVVLATGRARFFMEFYAHELGLQTPVITCNGGYVYDMVTGSELLAKYIPPERAVQIRRCLAEYRIPFMVYTAKHVFITEDNPRMELKRKLRMRGTDLAERACVTIDPATFDPTVEPVIKFFINPVTREQADLLKNELNPDGALEMVFSGPQDFDINAAGVSKGRAVRAVAEQLGFSLKHIACFGDSFNDISMLQAAGCSVAMGNAEEEVKRAAQFVTLPNTQSGFSYGIKNIIGKMYLQGE